ncbi:phage integrase SAM-like domain-containing protein [Aestuariibaculum sediminum]|uniref:Site-specific integrase n=1 Tax=Aestuariibaculum sediminum TaxID=2770637 RepID=A0A8J6Q1W2_9FLAO|nr:phage integrase SAM-like domain-containing protein [Aestuariibaculum sediminum]MBD0831319.1 site-specific integrase [Aestuariibaculum sediminum]
MSNINPTTGTIAFRLKQSTSKKETPILFEYSFGRGNRIKYSTGYKILPKYWDIKNQKIRAIASLDNRDDVNNKLLKIKTDFSTALSELEEAEKHDKDILKSIYDVVMKRSEPKEASLPKLKFLQFADDFVETKENAVNSGINLTAVTIRSYKQTIKQLKDFNNTYRYKLDFDTIDVPFYYAFVSFLEEKEYSLNTIGKHIKNIIALMNRATEDGINTNLKYKHRDFKRLSEKTTSIYLNTEEIENLYKLDLSFNKDWERARDIFLIGYYTGQRVSDYNGLTGKNIKIFDGREVFEIYQKKTKKTVYIPIHPRIKEIINKRYNGNLPAKMPDHLINSLIKKVGRKAKIKDDVVTKKTVGGKLSEKTIDKHELIGTHTARRSFCTNAYLSKMPVIDIMALSGHTTEKEFYNYIKVTPQERAVKIADSAFFK